MSANPFTAEVVRQGIADHLTLQARALVYKAQALGMVLTIDLVPNKPLAMGNYTPVVNVRSINVREAS